MALSNGAPRQWLLDAKKRKQFGLPKGTIQDDDWAVPERPEELPEILAAIEQHTIAVDLRQHADQVLRAAYHDDEDDLQNPDRRSTRDEIDRYLLWVTTGVKFDALQDLLDGKTPLKHRHAIDFQLAHLALDAGQRRRESLPLLSVPEALVRPWAGDQELYFDAMDEVAPMRRRYTTSRPHWTQHPSI